MNALVLVALLVVAAGGTATVLTRDPVRQAVVSGIFGVALGVLFFVLGAPDVALSEMTVAGIAVPVMVLLTLANIREREREEDEE